MDNAPSITHTEETRDLGGHRLVWSRKQNLCGPRTKKERTLEISTTGRRTGRSHKREIWSVTQDNRLFIGTRDDRRDWVRNTVKNPNVEITIKEITRRMRATPVRSETEKEALSKLYGEKYSMSSLGASVPSSRVSMGLRMLFELTPM